MQTTPKLDLDSEVDGGSGAEFGSGSGSGFGSGSGISAEFEVSSNKASHTLQVYNKCFYSCTFRNFKL